MKRLLVILLFFPMLLIGDEQKYNKQLVIPLYDKTLKELTIIKEDFDKVAEKHGLTVSIQNISELELKWQRLKAQSANQR